MHRRKIRVTLVVCGVVACAMAVVAAAQGSRAGGGNVTVAGVIALAGSALGLGLLTAVVDTAALLPKAVSAIVDILCSKPAPVHAQIKALVRLYAGVPVEARGQIAADRLAFGALGRSLAEGTH